MRAPSRMQYILAKHFSNWDMSKYGVGGNEILYSLSYYKALLGATRGHFWVTPAMQPTLLAFSGPRMSCRSHSSEPEVASGLFQSILVPETNRVGQGPGATRKQPGLQHNSKHDLLWKMRWVQSLRTVLFAYLTLQ